MRSRFHAPIAAACAIIAAGCTPADAPDRKAVGMANPASVHCAEQGGRLEIRKGEDGDSGYCHLPDGRVVEEWEFFRAQNGDGAAAATPDAAHNSRNALDWAGSYRGVLPCADCEGIETIVTLRADGSYTESARYLGRSDSPAISEGRFEWDAAGGVITLSGEESARYRVGENRLARLAMGGTAITGALADNYVLAKSGDGITETYWKLVELGGKPVPALEREPHLILKSEGGRVTGFGGCNSFTGAYTLDEKASRISFGQIASTMRACPTGMDAEKAFADVLGRVDNYSRDGDRLSLNRARMAPLARFEAVWLR